MADNGDTESVGDATADSADGISLDRADRVSLYAASRYIGLKTQEKLELRIPFDARACCLARLPLPNCRAR